MKPIKPTKRIDLATARLHSRRASLALELAIAGALLASLALLFAAPIQQPGAVTSTSALQPAPVPRLAAGGLVQVGGSDPLGVTITLSGTGSIDGTYRADRVVPINPAEQLYVVSLINPGVAWPRASIGAQRQILNGAAGWVGNCWHQVDSSGNAANGTSHAAEFALTGGDPVTGGTAVGVGKWLPAKTAVSMSVSP